MRKKIIFSGDAKSPEFQKLCNLLDLYEDLEGVQGFLCDNPSVAVYNYSGRLNDKNFDHFVEVFVWEET